MLLSLNHAINALKHWYQSLVTLSLRGLRREWSWTNFRSSLIFYWMSCFRGAFDLMLGDVFKLIVLQTPFTRIMYLQKFNVTCCMLQQKYFCQKHKNTGTLHINKYIYIYIYIERERERERKRDRYNIHYTFYICCTLKIGRQLVKRQVSLTSFVYVVFSREYFD